MIKQIRPSYYHNLRNTQYCCLSTDLDPVPSHFENGDEVYVIDTGKRYYWNAASSSLVEKKAPISLPSGGTSGQVLVKNGSDDGDASWQTLSGDLSIVGFDIDNAGILTIASE